MKTVDKKYILAGLLLAAAVAPVEVNAMTTLKPMLPIFAQTSPTKLFSNCFVLQNKKFDLTQPEKQCFKTNKQSEQSFSNNNSQKNKNSKYAYAQPTSIGVLSLCAATVASTVYFLVKKYKKNKDSKIILSPCLPCEKDIAKILHDLGLSHFNEKTKFAKKLGGAQLSAFEILDKIEHAIADYIETFSDAPTKKTMAIQMHMVRPILLKELLIGFPKETQEVFQELLDPKVKTTKE